MLITHVIIKFLTQIIQGMFYKPVILMRNDKFNFISDVCHLRYTHFPVHLCVVENYDILQNWISFSFLIKHFYTWKNHFMNQNKCYKISIERLLNK